jgi:hypothetical protein
MKGCNIGLQDHGIGEWNADVLAYRESSTSVVIARSSGSRMANPNLYSSSARTLAVLRGPSSSEDSTRRVSLRYS